MLLSAVSIELGSVPSAESVHTSITSRRMSKGHLPGNGATEMDRQTVFSIPAADWLPETLHSRIVTKIISLVNADNLSSEENGNSALEELALIFEEHAETIDADCLAKELYNTVEIGAVLYILQLQLISQKQRSHMQDFVISLSGHLCSLYAQTAAEEGTLPHQIYGETDISGSHEASSTNPVQFVIESLESPCKPVISCGMHCLIMLISANTKLMAPRITAKVHSSLLKLLRNRDSSQNSANDVDFDTKEQATRALFALYADMSANQVKSSTVTLPCIQKKDIIGSVLDLIEHSAPQHLLLMALITLYNSSCIPELRATVKSRVNSQNLCSVLSHQNPKICCAALSTILLTYYMSGDEFLDIEMKYSSLQPMPEFNTNGMMLGHGIDINYVLTQVGQTGLAKIASLLTCSDPEWQIHTAELLTSLCKIAPLQRDSLVETGAFTSCIQMVAYASNRLVFQALNFIAALLTPHEAWPWESQSVRALLSGALPAILRVQTFSELECHTAMFSVLALLSGAPLAVRESVVAAGTVPLLLEQLLGHSTEPEPPSTPESIAKATKLMWMLANLTVVQAACQQLLDSFPKLQALIAWIPSVEPDLRAALVEVLLNLTQEASALVQVFGDLNTMQALLSLLQPQGSTPFDLEGARAGLSIVAMSCADVRQELGIPYVQHAAMMSGVAGAVLSLSSHTDDTVRGAALWALCSMMVCHPTWQRIVLEARTVVSEPLWPGCEDAMLRTGPPSVSHYVSNRALMTSNSNHRMSRDSGERSSRNTPGSGGTLWQAPPPPTPRPTAHLTAAQRHLLSARITFWRILTTCLVANESDDLGPASRDRSMASLVVNAINYGAVVEALTVLLCDPGYSMRAAAVLGQAARSEDVHAWLSVNGSWTQLRDLLVAALSGSIKLTPEDTQNMLSALADLAATTEGQAAFANRRTAERLISYIRQPAPREEDPVPRLALCVLARLCGNEAVRHEVVSLHLVPRLLELLHTGNSAVRGAASMLLAAVATDTVDIKQAGLGGSDAVHVLLDVIKDYRRNLDNGEETYRRLYSTHDSLFSHKSSLMRWSRTNTGLSNVDHPHSKHTVPTSGRRRPSSLLHTVTRDALHMFEAGLGLTVGAQPSLGQPPAPQSFEDVNLGTVGALPVGGGGGSTSAAASVVFVVEALEALAGASGREAVGTLGTLVALEDIVWLMTQPNRDMQVAAARLLQALASNRELHPNFLDANVTAPLLTHIATGSDALQSACLSILQRLSINTEIHSRLVTANLPQSLLGVLRSLAEGILATVDVSSTPKLDRMSFRATIRPSISRQPTRNLGLMDALLKSPSMPPIIASLQTPSRSTSFDISAPDPVKIPVVILDMNSYHDAQENPSTPVAPNSAGKSPAFPAIWRSPTRSHGLMVALMVSVHAIMADKGAIEQVRRAGGAEFFKRMLHAENQERAPELSSLARQCLAAVTKPVLAPSVADLSKCSSPDISRRNTQVARRQVHGFVV